MAGKEHKMSFQGLMGNTKDGKGVMIRLVILVALVFVCEMLFLHFTEDMRLDENAIVEELEAMTEVAGVGWTDFMPVWFINFFASNDQADQQMAGVGWTDFVPAWFFNFFASNDQAAQQVAGVGWTDFMPTWWFNLFIG